MKFEMQPGFGKVVQIIDGRGAKLPSIVKIRPDELWTEKVLNEVLKLHQQPAVLRQARRKVVMLVRQKVPAAQNKMLKPARHIRHKHQWPEFMD